MSSWWNPFRSILFLRWLWSEWITPPGKVTILAIIASLNAVWGYPLVGLLASLVTLFVIAALTNFLLRPRLSAMMKLPEMVSANSRVEATLSIENKASTPVFNLILSLTALPRGWVVAGDSQRLSQIDPREKLAIGYTLQVGRRGEYPWPMLRCVTGR